MAGVERNVMAVTRDGEPLVLTVSDRLRPPGRGFGVALAHVYPCSLDAEGLATVTHIAAAAVRALGLRDGIAYPQLIVTPEGRTVVVEVAARIPGGQMGDLVRIGTGVDLVDVAVRQALGEQVGDDDVSPRFLQSLAVRFLTASRGLYAPREWCAWAVWSGFSRGRASSRQRRTFRPVSRPPRADRR